MSSGGFSVKFGPRSICCMLAWMLDYTDIAAINNEWGSSPVISRLNMQMDPINAHGWPCISSLTARCAICQRKG